MKELLSRAKWIWPARAMYLQNCYAGFRYDFELNDIPGKAPLHLTADQSYRLYVNGKYVCRGPARGYQEEWPFDTVDIAGFLKKGKNFIAVEAYNPGISTFSYNHKDRASFICAAKWENGTEFYSNRETWQMFRLHSYAAFTGRLSVQMNFQEDIDLQQDERKWITDEEFTPPAQEKWVRMDETPFSALPWFDVKPRPIPMFDEHCYAPAAAVLAGYGKAVTGKKQGGNISWDFAENELSSIEWQTPPLFHKDGEFLCGEIPAAGEGNIYAVTFDLGEEWLTGTPILEVANGSAGDVIELHYYHYLPDGKAELLPEPGVGSLLAPAARLHLNGPAVRHEFFQIMGVRHITLVVRENRNPLKVRLSWRTALYPMEISGDFTSSDSLLNDIYRICRHTQKVCSMDVFVDTPWREQSQWWGDARIQAKNTLWLSGDDRLLKNGINLIAGQKGAPDGLIFTNAPTTDAGNILPDFTLTWIATLYDLYFQTADPEAVLPYLPQAEKIFAYFEKYRSDFGIIGYDERFWLFEDWGDLPKKPYPAFLNLWHCHVLELYAKLQKFCGLDHSETLRKIAWEKELLKEKYFNTELGLMMPVLNEKGEQTGTPSVHDQVLALMLDLVPEARENMIQKRIKPCLEGTLNEGAQPGPFWSTYLLDIASSCKLRKEALAYIARRWQHMIPSGTVWEVFDRGSYTGWSYSHAWSAHPLTHIPELLGITQKEPGWRKIAFEPFFADIADCDISIPSPLGIVKAGWHKEDGHFNCYLELPGDMTAQITVDGKETTAQGHWTASL
ncbi:MAG: hypothetical protein IJW17_01590 [Lentisphaeria bacterium]|nr:hypothetical protein [Lentisphaeria bacterium]